MATVFSFDAMEAERLFKALEGYQGDAESAINDVLHNEAGDMAQEAIKKLIPVSGRTWRGKKRAAKTAKSLKNVTGNLFVKVTTTKNYQYLYFPDDGTNTVKHVGEQQFFARGGESVKDEIINRCINKLVNKFEEGV